MIGIDVGGANLKVVDGDVHIHYCPLWQEAPITEILMSYAGEEAAVVMSGELADSFENKQAGISFIVDAVKSALPDARFYGTDGAFHTGPVPELAAANWLASADYLRSLYPESVLVDMGSTTVDIIPLNRFESLKGMTDLDRLKKGYLVYTGLLRTTLPALLRTVMIDGTETLISSEYFAVSADVHLVLGHISESGYAAPTPDGAAVTRDASLRRLSRLVCADLSEIGEAQAVGVAEQFWDEQKKSIGVQVRRVMDETGAKSVVTAGIASHLLAGEFGWTDLNAGQHGGWADALPAYAVKEVALRKKQRESLRLQSGE